MRRAPTTTTRAAVWIGAFIAWAGCGVGQVEPPPEPITPPFIVSDYYSPDGFWGDGETRGYLDLQKGCPDRAPGASGDCYTITYTPGPRRFAGINWQYPHNNWGFWRGRSIAVGATTIRVQARGSIGGEVVSFGAGQIGGANPYNDTFTLSPISSTLATGWTTTVVGFRSANYVGPDGVLGAFIVSLTAGQSDATVVFYLDDIRWEP